LLRMIVMDLLSLKKRWLLHVLLLVMLAYLGYMVAQDYHQATRIFESHLAFSYADFAEAASQLSEGETEVYLSYEEYDDQGELYSIGYYSLPVSQFDRVILPGALQTKYRYMNLLPVILAIMAASIVGSEYSTRTLHKVLAKGVPRINYFGAKLINLGILTIAFILTCVVFIFVAGLITTWLITGNISWSFITTGFAGSVLLNVGYVALMMMVYVCFSAFVTVMLKSSIAGIIAGVVIFFIDGAIMGQVAASNPNSWLGYTISYNVTYLFELISPSPVNDGIFNSLSTNPLQAVTVLSLYCGLFILASFLVFRRQDLTSG
jgi:ABC-type transport system involved in multi-copper enzyme maturation permease subunit